MTYTEFFENLNAGARWDVGVSINRSNSLPLDANSVFPSYSELELYAAGTPSEGRLNNAYPGQIVAVVTADGTTLYYLDQNMTPCKVGASIEAANASIEIVDGKITIGGFADAESLTLPQKQADGTIRWIPISEIVEGDGNTVTSVSAADKSVVVEKTTDTDTERVYTVKANISTADGNKITLDETGLYVSEYDDSAINEAIESIQSDLANYYTKTEIDSTVDELEGKISAIPKFSIEVATRGEDGYPSVTEPSDSTVYLVPDNDTATADVYDEYIYVNGAWELLGKQTLDLSNYYTKSEVDSAINEVAADVAELTTEVDALADIPGRVTALEDAGYITESALEGYAKSSDVTTEITTTIDSKLEDYDSSDEVDAKIKVVQDAVDAIEVPVKTVAESEFTLTDGNLSLKAVEIAKVTGLAEALSAKADADNVYSKSETDQVIADKVAEVTGGESAAAVLAQLNAYKSSNDERVEDIETKLATVAEGAQVNVIESISVDGEALAITEKGVNIDIASRIPAVATTTKVGTVLSTAYEADEDGNITSAENTVAVDSDGVMTVNSLNVTRLVQSDSDTLILDGGLAENI